MNNALGLYVHVPFCVHKCGYCDFNSWAETSRGPQEQWLEAMRRQIDHWAARLPAGIKVDSVFWGGGTPSLLQNDVLVSAGQHMRTAFNVAPSVEWTMECNPETIDASKLQALADAGANRLSVGVQSFRDHHLERLERRARRGDNLRALELIAREWGGRWSFDLMFGLPGQSFAEWSEDLSTALSFGSTHLSAYQLTLTTARSRAWSQPDEDTLLAMFDFTEAQAARAQLAKYETSNFARPGHESRHNLRYWQLESFVGLGPGAAGLLSGRFLDSETQNPWGVHQKNPDRFESWIQGAGNSVVENSWFTPRSAMDHLHEMLLMGLRLKAGLPEARLGGLRGAFWQAAKSPQLSELIENSNSVWRATPKGSQQLDTLLAGLLNRLEKLAPGHIDFAQIDPTF
ncbi:MAG: radical SAM family heme chaperone HemW [Bdellovibrionales bacterium]|nr:radical SAM family heme chaperone HemW [Bdellovibrionales bacterium]